MPPRQLGLTFDRLPCVYCCIDGLLYTVEIGKSSACITETKNEEIRVVVYVQIAALRFIDAGAGDRSNEKRGQEEIRVLMYVQIAALQFIDAGAGDRSNEKKKKLQIQATSGEWGFLITGLCLEILSLAFDQASSPSQPLYALFAMIFAIAAVLVCIWELIYKGRKERVVLRPWGRLWWFYHPHPQHGLFGTVLDFMGIFGGIAQCICSIVQFACFLLHADNPIKVSLWPAIFLICLIAKRLNDNPNEICDERGD
ncbi:PREDICTED: uncharacterized protein LOC103342431 isoform X2 [Prunus mume]|uniref:Uncharacterized protein LOC103342431 isoform X2 n=1 Tax=Prunus mume TaxID=102107 RepID=A0ABM0PTL4_PRUMU|nr:PREDICTED: uncharacterized protein LOC103342431 isoform X2 [Prunus mume]